MAWSDTQHRPGPPEPRVMLLSVWATAAGVWHAQLIDTEARRIEFDSPFELARFLAQAGNKAPVGAAAETGLR